ncbi:MAG: HAD-IA family hydrolase [Wenzhouxiangellaceae bacterium]
MRKSTTGGNGRITSLDSAVDSRIEDPAAGLPECSASGMHLEAILFDLDGTLLDSAPDLVAALARLRLELDLPGFDFRPLRAAASRGATAILERGLPELDEHDRLAFLPRYLDDYQTHCWEASRVFDGIPECLEAIEAQGLVWGVVTNKIERLAVPVLEQAGWLGRSGCLIAGDTTAWSKPSPEPVLAACRKLGIDPRKTLFVGDDRRDIDAGRAAGTGTAVALWGYIESNDDPADWSADRMLESPAALYEFLLGGGRA